MEFKRHEPCPANGDDSGYSPYAKEHVQAKKKEAANILGRPRPIDTWLKEIDPTLEQYAAVFRGLGLGHTCMISELRTEDGLTTVADTLTEAGCNFFHLRKTRVQPLKSI